MIVYRAIVLALTPTDASVCIARVKWLLLFSLLCAATACTTLENRRDLYRSPLEGYEEWYPEPPPTRKPAGPPASTTTAPAEETVLPEHGH